MVSGLGGDATCGLRDVERETEREQARPTELAEETNKKSQYLFSADPNLYNNRENHTEKAETEAQPYAETIPS